MKGWVLRIACLLSMMISVLLALQLCRVVRTLGVGWGDPVKARGYYVGLSGGLVFRVAWGFKQPLGGTSQPYNFRMIQQFDAAGIQWQRADMTVGPPSKANTLASTADLRISIGWPIGVSLLLAALWWIQSARLRRIARSEQLCAKCGYDLRATPERCPECGSVPAVGKV